MRSKTKEQECCAGPIEVEERYKVEAIVTVDDRGQMVLPKEVRRKFDLKQGDKLAVVIMERQGKICCLQLLKAEDFSDKVKGMVGTPAEGSR